MVVRLDRDFMSDLGLAVRQFRLVVFAVLSLSCLYGLAKHRFWAEWWCSWAHIWLPLTFLLSLPYQMVTHEHATPQYMHVTVLFFVASIPLGLWLALV